MNIKQRIGAPESQYLYTRYLTPNTRYLNVIQCYGGSSVCVCVCVLFTQGYTCSSEIMLQWFTFLYIFLKKMFPWHCG